MSVPVVDVGALVRELGAAPGLVDEKFDAVELSEEARAAVDALHMVCRGGAGGLIAVNHGCPVEEVLKASAAFHAQDRAAKDVYAPSGIYDGYGRTRAPASPPRGPGAPELTTRRRRRRDTAQPRDRQDGDEVTISHARTHVRRARPTQTRRRPDHG